MDCLHWQSLLNSKVLFSEYSEVAIAESLMTSLIENGRTAANVNEIHSSSMFENN